MKNKEFNEITMEVTVSLEELEKILAKNNFKKIQEYDMHDLYMFERDCDFARKPLEILRDALLIRSVIVGEKTINKLVYKWKEYNEKSEIVKQAKVSCGIDSVYDAEHILNIINWIRIFEINNHSIVYVNDKTELVIQLVNNEHIYIEIEEYSETLNKQYESIEQMKKEFLSYNIPIKNNDFFVKKAEIELIKYLNNKN